MFLMRKSIISLLVSSLNAQDANSESTSGGVDLGRRYKDLKGIALHYMPDFDERKVTTTML